MGAVGVCFRSLRIVGPCSPVGGSAVSAGGYYAARCAHLKSVDTVDHGFWSTTHAGVSAGLPLSAPTSTRAGVTASGFQAARDHRACPAAVAPRASCPNRRPVAGAEHDRIERSSPVVVGKHDEPDACAHCAGDTLAVG